MIITLLRSKVMADLVSLEETAGKYFKLYDFLPHTSRGSIGTF